MNTLPKVKGERYWICIAADTALIAVLHFLVFTRYSPLLVLEELYFGGGIGSAPIK